MFDTEVISHILIRAFVSVLGFGYVILAFLVYRQVVILCRILGTNLSALLKILSILHIIVILSGSVIVFFLV